jgi:hypothetical protein
VVAPAPAPRRTRQRLGRVLAAAAVVAFTLAGGAPAEADVVEAAGRWTALLLAAAQGAVVGALIGVSHRRAGAARPAAVVGAGLAAALAVAGGPDAWAAVAPRAAVTAFSCAAAAWLAARLSRGTSAAAPVAGALSADYPLVGLVYLALCAAWLLASTATTAVDAAAASCVALFGASLIASVRASRGPAARGGAAGTALLVACWAALGLAPLCAREPVATLTLVLVLTLTAGATAAWLGPTATERRFERRALLRAAPALAGAAVAHVLGADAMPGPLGWEGALVLPAIDGALGAHAGLAALCGYAAAELRGRAPETPHEAWRAVAPWVVALAAGAELARELLHGAGASAWRAALAVGAARLGAALYHAWRDHVQALARVGRARARVLGPGAAPDAG